MAKKTYKSLTGIQYTFPVRGKEKTHWISFAGDQNDYVTSNKEIQQALESHPLYNDGQIGLAYSGAKKDETGTVTAAVEYAKVKDLNEAVSVLRGEPYKVSPARLTDREAVRSIAGELGVSFPNLPEE